MSSKLTNKECFEMALEHLDRTLDVVNYKWMAVGWLLHQGMDVDDAIVVATSWAKP